LLLFIKERQNPPAPSNIFENVFLDEV